MNTGFPNSYLKEGNLGEDTYGSLKQQLTTTDATTQKVLIVTIALINKPTGHEQAFPAIFDVDWFWNWWKPEFKYLSFKPLKDIQTHVNTINTMD